MAKSIFPKLGFGLGLRAPHIPEALNHQTRAEWFEVISENYMGIPGQGWGPALQTLIQVRERYPVVLHGVSMSLASAGGLDFNYLQRLKDLITMIEPAWVSDHLAWSAWGQAYSHDLLPLVYSTQNLENIRQKILRVQDFLQRPLLIENISSYLEFKTSEMSEFEFIADLCRSTGCYLLLDLNNIYVNSVNHSKSMTQMMAEAPWDRVQQIHLAGPRQEGSLLIDTHDQSVRPEVWQMYRQVLEKNIFPATMIEWDDHIPPLSELEKELDLARQIYQGVQTQKKSIRESHV